MQRIQVNHRRFGFKVGGMIVAVKEYKTERSPARPLTFAVSVPAEFQRKELRKEIMRKIAPSEA